MHINVLGACAGRIVLFFTINGNCCTFVIIVQGVAPNNKALRSTNACCLESHHSAILLNKHKIVRGIPHTLCNGYATKQNRHQPSRPCLPSNSELVKFKMTQKPANPRRHVGTAHNTRQTFRQSSLHPAIRLVETWFMSIQTGRLSVIGLVTDALECTLGHYYKCL